MVDIGGDGGVESGREGVMVLELVTGAAGTPVVGVAVVGAAGKAEDSMKSDTGLLRLRLRRAYE
jgi:hypothetical protein